jgi:NAD+ synthase
MRWGGPGALHHAALSLHGGGKPADAADCAERLGVRYDVLPIAPAVEGFPKLLRPLFDGMPPDVTEENIQSRARGTALMAVSNKLGLMLITTGNKSEVSVGIRRSMAT